MSHTRVISILGASPYDPVCYRLTPTSAHCAPTPHFVRALVDLLQGPLRVVVIGTDFARRKNGTALEESLKEAGVPYGIRPVPDGRDRSEQLKLFTTVRALLRDAPLTELGEVGPPREIVLDVTHGFRVQPMLAMAAVTEAAAVWRRAGRGPQLRIVYGGYVPQNKRDYPLAEDYPDPWDPPWHGRDAGKPKPAAERHRIAEIWDLTEFVRQGEWSASVDALLRFGRGDDLAHLASEAAATAEPDAAAWLTETSTLVAAFADLLCLGQAPTLVTQRAAPLLEHLDRVPASMQDQPVLSAALETLRRKLVPLVATDPVSPESLPAYQHLARWYLNLQRFAEALTLSTEARTLHAAARLGVKVAARPGEPAFKAAWAHVEQGAGRADEPGDLRVARNAVAHAGFHARLLEPEALRARVTEAVESFEALVADQVAPPVPGAPTWVILGGEPLPAPRLTAIEREAQADGAALITAASLESKKSKDRKTAKDLCAAADRALKALVSDRSLTRAYFGPGCGLSDIPLLTGLQSSGVICFLWQWKGNPDPKTGARTDGDWTEAPEVARLVG